MDNTSLIRRAVDTWYDDWFAMDRLYYEWARHRGITGNILFTLYAIDALGEGCTPGKVVDKLALSKQTVNSTLNTLEAKGFVVREKDPLDQRSRRIRLTETGQAYTKELLNDLYQAEQAAFSALGEELPHMIALNRRLAQAIRKELSIE